MGQCLKHPGLSPQSLRCSWSWLPMANPRGALKDVELVEICPKLILHLSVQKQKRGNLHGAFPTTSFTLWIQYIARNRSGSALVLTPCYLTFFSQVLKLKKIYPKQSVIVTVTRLIFIGSILLPMQNQISFPAYILLPKYHKYFSNVSILCPSLIFQLFSCEFCPTFPTSLLHLQMVNLSYPLVEVFQS